MTIHLNMISTDRLWYFIYMVQIASMHKMIITQTSNSCNMTKCKILCSNIFLPLDRDVSYLLSRSCLYKKRYTTSSCTHSSLNSCNTKKKKTFYSQIYLNCQIVMFVSTIWIILKGYITLWCNCLNPNYCNGTKKLDYLFKYVSQLLDYNI